jgi:hypothetical protein
MATELERRDFDKADDAMEDLRNLRQSLHDKIYPAKQSSATTVKFDPANPSTWDIQPVDNRVTNYFPGTAGTDRRLLNDISHARKGDRNNGTKIETGVAMHQHCGGGRGGGSCGISFAYSHGEGRTVTPVIYDYGPKTAGTNDFSWNTGGRSNAPSALPGDIKR